MFCVSLCTEYIFEDISHVNCHVVHLDNMRIPKLRREKTGLQGFRPGLTQTDLYSHRSGTKAWNFGLIRREIVLSM